LANSKRQTAQDAQQSLMERLSAAERERDEGRKEVVTVNNKMRTAYLGPFRHCADCPEMVVVPAGRFMMGSVDGRPEEKPVHEVTIPGPFAVGKYEVTFAEWEACVVGGGCKSNKSPDDARWGKGRRPVINVSWNDAKEYVSWLSGQA